MIIMEEYKIGDWVITKGYTDYYDGIPLQINKISERYYYFNNNKNLKSYRKEHNFSKEMILKRAELHEIPVKFRNILQTIEIW